LALPDLRVLGSARERPDSDTNWHHVAVVFDGGNQVKFYIDGALDSTKTLNQTGSSSSLAHLQVGGAEGFSRFDGDMAFFSLYDGQRTDFSHGAFALIASEPSLRSAVLSLRLSPARRIYRAEIERLSQPWWRAASASCCRQPGNVGHSEWLLHRPVRRPRADGCGRLHGQRPVLGHDPIAAGATVTLTTVISQAAAPGSLSQK